MEFHFWKCSGITYSTLRLRLRAGWHSRSQPRGAAASRQEEASQPIKFGREFTGWHGWCGTDLMGWTNGEELVDAL